MKRTERGHRIECGSLASVYAFAGPLCRLFQHPTLDDECDCQVWVQWLPPSFSLDLIYFLCSLARTGEVE